MSRSKMVGTRPSVSVSQNFLTGRKVINRLLNLTTINKKDYVIEIGPGKGHITAPLAERAGRVDAVEIDGRLFAGLQEKLGDRPNLRLIQGDFLRWSLPPRESYKVFANIPYCITTEIIRKLTGGTNPAQEIWLVMEKGAAKRFCGQPRESAASLGLKPFYEVEIVCHLRREDFHPKPSVDSVLIHFKRKAEPDIPPHQEKLYRNFIGQCTKDSRGFSRVFTKNQLNTALKRGKIPQGFSRSDLLYIQWLCLFRCHLHFHHLE